MVTHYCCSHDATHTAEGKPYLLEIKQETLMDEKNVADMFCPICHAPLTKCTPSEDASSPGH
jgi:hypothetical protein